MQEASKIHHAKHQDAAIARAPKMRVTFKSDALAHTAPSKHHHEPVCVKWKCPGEAAPKRKPRADRRAPVAPKIKPRAPRRKPPAPGGSPRHMGDVD